MMRLSARAWALLASLTVVAFAACDGEGGGVVPLDRPVQLSVTPTFDGPDRVPPALDPRSLRARVTDLTEATEFHDETAEVTPGSVFEGGLEFSVPAGLSEVALFLELAAEDGTLVWASGPDTVLIPDEGDPGTVSPVLQWVGPGAGAARLELSPDVVALDAGDDTTLVVTAFDQAGNPVAGTTEAVDWVSLSTDLGDFVDQSGRWQSNGTRGEVQVVATLSPQRLSDTTRIIVQAAPSRLQIVGGDEQRAPAGSTLPEPVAVQVIATDDEPLAGRTVLFQPENGGTVGQTSVVADAEGVARTSWTLGAEVGPQTLRIQVEGRPEIFAEVSADATPVDFQAPTDVNSAPESGGAPPGGISVSWVSADPNVELFQVGRSLDGGLSWSAVGGNLPARARNDVEAGPSGSWGGDEEVLHRVRGCDAQGAPCSGWTVSAEPAYTLPLPPAGLTAEVVEVLPTGTVLSVRWTNENDYVTGFEVCDTDAPGGACTVQQLPPTADNVRFETSVAGDSALIIVTALSPGGEAEASVWVQLATLADFSIRVISGNEQEGLVESGLSDPLVVEVEDAFGAPAEGVDVSFTPQGDGTATPALATTDAQGRASTTWTLGPAVGTQTLFAELTSASSVFVEFTAEAALAPIDAPTSVEAAPSFGEGEFDGFIVTWESSDPNVERFRVDRRLNGDEGWTAVADALSGEDRSFFDATSFAMDREVTYRVQGCDAEATNCSGFGVAANPVYTPPSAPTDLAAEATGTNELGVIVALSWTDTNLFNTGYTVCDSQTPGGACEVKSVGRDETSLTFTTPFADSVFVTVTAVNPTDSASAGIWVQLPTLADYSIAVVSGDGQDGALGEDLAAPVVVEVQDSFGEVAAGVDVSFAPQDGGTATPGSATTDAQGRVSTTWTLGSTVGPQTLRAEISEAPSVHTLVTATAVAANVPPTANPGGPYAARIGASATLDGSGSEDPDGTISTWSWRIDDGSEPTGLVGETVSYTCAEPGTYDVTLTVTDNDGATDSAATTVACQANALPTADAGPAYSGIVGQSVGFDGSGSSDSDGTIESWSWTVADSVPPTLLTGEQPDYICTVAGTFDVTLVVRDNDGDDSAPSQTTVTCVEDNLPPTADAGGPYSGTVGADVPFDGSGSFDPDEDALTYAWSVADGGPTLLSGVTPSYPCSAEGTFVVTLTVDDGDLSDSDATGSVTCSPPAAPASVAAFASIDEEGFFLGFEVDWSSSDPAIDLFEIQRSLNGGETWQNGNPPTNSLGGYVDSGDEGWGRDLEVFYRVRGCNDLSCSDWTETVEPVYTLPQAPSGLSGDWLEIIEDGPVLQISWTDTNNFEDGYDVCVEETLGGGCDLIELGPDTDFKEFVAFVDPGASSVIVTVTAVNPTGEASSNIVIDLPGLASDLLSFNSLDFGSYSSPVVYREWTFENLQETDLFIGTFEESSNVICALDQVGEACTSAMGISFDEPVWNLKLQTGGDEISGVLGELELELYDGVETTFQTVQLSGDGEPGTVEFHDLSGFGTVVGMTWVPEAGVGLMGFTLFDFLARDGAFPPPFTFAPEPSGAGPQVRNRSR